MQHAPKQATIIQSERDLYAAAIGVPTKWFIDIEVYHKGARECVTFRLYRKRRGGTLHIQTHRDSRFKPGLTIPVAGSRPRYRNFIRAGEALIDASMMDPNRDEQYPLSVWNKRSPHYPERGKHIEVIMTYLTELLDPQRGRKSNAAPATKVPPGMPLSKHKARSARKTVFLHELGAAYDLMTPLLGYLDDGRSMAGFTEAERAKISNYISEISLGIRDLMHELKTDDLVDHIVLPGDDEPFVDLR